MTTKNPSAAVGLTNPHADLSGVANRLALAYATYREGDVDSSFDIFIAAMRSAETASDVETAAVELSSLIETALNNALCTDVAASEPAGDDADFDLDTAGLDDDDWLGDRARPGGETAADDEGTGVSLEELAAQGEEDLRTRHEIADWRDRLFPSDTAAVPAPKALSSELVAANLAALDALD